MIPCLGSSISYTIKFVTQFRPHGKDRTDKSSGTALDRVTRTMPSAPETIALVEGLKSKKEDDLRSTRLKGATMECCHGTRDKVPVGA